MPQLFSITTTDASDTLYCAQSDLTYSVSHNGGSNFVVDIDTSTVTLLSDTFLGTYTVVISASLDAPFISGTST